MKLGIGTAQFGLDYGISNQEGKTPLKEVAKILEIAHKNGVNAIDTASLYGTSEEVLGKTIAPHHNFDIFTKTPQFLKDNITIDDVDLLEKTFHQSLCKLQQLSIYALLIHRADDILAKNGHLLIEKMLSMKKQGLIKKIGISVYTGEQIDNIISNYSIDIIQIPINVLDQRLLKSGHLSKLKNLSIEIHARSIFLQGLLLMPIDSIPSYFEHIKSHLYNYYNFIKNADISTIEAAITFILCLEIVDNFICGINNCSQLQEILSAIQNIKTELGTALMQFAITDESILNPYEWKI